MLFCALRPSESTDPSSLDNTKTTTEGLLRGKRSEGGTVGHIARGTVIGRYTILDHLGSGGMASVYSAYDTQLERIVAIKMLRAELEIEEVRVRMLREAQAMARLKHEHVVTVYEVGTFEHRIYIAMEFVDGKTLSSWSREPRPWRELLKMLKAAGRGLAAAHDAGLVHRDFKPDNVLVGKDGHVLVSDFGIARSHGSDFGIARSHGSTGASSEPALEEAQREPATSITEVRTRGAPRGGSLAATGTMSADGSAGVEANGALDDGIDSGSSLTGQPSSSLTDRLTEEGTVLGTPGFIAPEHLFSNVDDARSDQFSFCVSMYRVLYGKRPFEFRNLPTYCEAVQRPPEPPPAKTAVPGWVHAIILRGLALDPARRFASMHELLEALEQDPARKYRAWGAAAIALMGAAAGLVAYGRHRAEVRRQCAEGDVLMAATWNEEAGLELRSALLRTGSKRATDVADRATRALDQYASGWKVAYRSVAEATLVHGRQEAGVMARRLHCLEGAREQIAVVTQVLGHADAAMVQNALTAIYNLPAVAACVTTDVANLPALPAAPELRTRVLALERIVADATALTDAGEYTKAESAIARGVAEARAIPYVRAEAELLLAEGFSKQQRGDKKGALDSYTRAFVAAERAASDALAVRAASRVGHVIATWLRKPEEAERWVLAAEGIADRAGRDDSLRAEILRARFAVNMLGRSGENVAINDELVSLSRRLYGDRDMRVGRALGARAVTFEMNGQSERAIEDERAAIEILEALTGADNPALALDYFNLGASYSNLRRHAEAKDAYENALRLNSDSPPGSVTVNIYDGLADAHLHLSPPDVTISVVERGLEVARVVGEGEIRVWSLRAMRAEALAKKGNIAGKAAECKNVLAEQEKGGKVDPGAPYYPDALTCLGEAELALGDTKNAITHLERSASLTTRYLAMELPKVRFALARALRSAGRDPVRARELAESARDALRAAHGWEKDIAEMDRWLGEAVK